MTTSKIYPAKAVPQPRLYSRPPVVRNYVLSVEAFDHLKAMQRFYERETGVPLTNSQALEKLLIEDEVRRHQSTI